MRQDVLLLRGGILVELLKQKQFSPMKTAEIIVSLWTGTRGYLDKVATKEILRFEALWLDHVKSTKFCEYLCAKVLPEWDSILSDDQNMLLRILAELCEHTEKFEQPKEAVANIHTVLMEYLPQASSTDGVPDTFNPEKNLEFTKVECLLYAFHTVAQMSSFLTDNPELFKELQSRLQQFALGIQGYIRKLREVLHGKTTAQLMADENKDNAKALKSCTNINSLIKDLLIPTPTYKTKIGLSWKPVSKI